MMKRHRGFVRGYLNTPQGPVWKVKVKDPQSQFNKQKFDVVFVPEGLELAPGLSIDFTVESFDDPLRGKVSKATGVRLQV